MNPGASGPTAAATNIHVLDKGAGGVPSLPLASSLSILTGVLSKLLWGERRKIERGIDDNADDGRCWKRTENLQRFWTRFLDSKRLFLLLSSSSSSSSSSSLLLSSSSDELL